MSVSMTSTDLTRIFGSQHILYSILSKTMHVDKNLSVLL